MKYLSIINSSIANRNATYKIACRRLLLCGLWGLLLPTVAVAAPKVVVSVLPVHSLVSAVMAGVGEARLLTPGGQSPHANQLKPSQVRALSDADLIVWIGAPLERSVGKIIAQRRAATRIVTLLTHEEITRLPSHQQDETQLQSQTEIQSHPAQNADPHLWLSFHNVRAIVRIVTRELVSIDPSNRKKYQDNAQVLLSRLEQLRQSLHQQLRAVAGKRYVVFHDAYRYFEQEFNLRPVASLIINAARPPGAKRIREIRQIIRTQKVSCVFSEPQFQPGLVKILIADTNASTGILDPLGSGLKPGADAWFQLMQRLADGLVECLG